MVMLLTFLVQAVAGLALSLALARIVGPDAFGRYALGLTAAVALNTVLFEWLRLSATRFAGEAEAPGTRTTLDRSYAATAAALILASGGAVALDLPLGLPPGLLAAAAATGLGMALVDYRAALARARFQDRAYAALTLTRTLLGAALALAAAFLSADPALMLAAAAASLGLTWLATKPVRAGPPGQAGTSLARTFAAYAWPLVAANALYQLMPVLNRAVLARMDGFSEVGVFALAGDLTGKLFMVAGTALDLVLFQAALREEALRGREAAERRIAMNAALVSAVLLPAAAGLWLILPALEALLVPAAFQGRFQEHVVWLIPATLLFALAQYALNPAFQLQRRTGPVIVAALTALGADAVLVAILPSWLGSVGVAVAQAAGFAAALAVITAQAARSGALRLPWRDLARAVAATGLMVLPLLPLRGSGVLVLLLVPPLGAVTYAAAALALDLAGCRTWLAERWQARAMRGVPAE